MGAYGAVAPAPSRIKLAVLQCLVDGALAVVLPIPFLLTIQPRLPKQRIDPCRIAPTPEGQMAA